MQEEQAALNSFVQLHAKKAVLSPERYVYLVHHSAGGVPLDVTLERFTIQNVLEMKQRFDAESRLVQYMIHQMNTYDPQKEIVIGLIFSRSNVLAHVVCVKPE